MKAIDEAYDRIKAQEVGERTDAHHCPQWVIWFDNGDSRFEETVKILNSRKLTANERQILIDAIAMTPLNITPSRAQWVRDSGLKWITRANVAVPRDLDLIGSLEYATIASCPFDPSEGEGYEKLWTHFQGSMFKRKNAFEWLK